MWADVAMGWVCGRGGWCGVRECQPAIGNENAKRMVTWFCGKKNQLGAPTLHACIRCVCLIWFLHKPPEVVRFCCCMLCGMQYANVYCTIIRPNNMVRDGKCIEFIEGRRIGDANGKDAQRQCLTRMRECVCECVMMLTKGYPSAINLMRFLCAQNNSLICVLLIVFEWIFSMVKNKVVV